MKKILKKNLIKINFYNRYIQIYEYVLNTHNGKNGNEKEKVYVVIYANNLANDGKGVLSWDLELDSKGYEEYNSAVNDYVTSKRNIIMYQR